MEPPPHSDADLVAIPVKSLDLGIPLVIGTLPWKPTGDQWMPFKHVVLGSCHLGCPVFIQMVRFLLERKTQTVGGVGGGVFGGGGCAWEVEGGGVW